MRPGTKITLLLAAALLVGIAPAQAGEIDDYIARPEPDAKWTKVSADATGEIEIIDVELISQKWRGIVWKHHVWIYKPKQPRHPDMSVLIVTGGSGRGAREQGLAVARSTGITCAILDSIPNQPLFDGMREDDLIAHTFLRYYLEGDPEWPLLFPMTKSAVKAMDAIEQLSAKEWGAKVGRFVITGASKRGWTTWLTGIVDQRVAGIMPIVFDNLNFGPQMKHQLEFWGQYSLQIQDYTRRGLQQRMDTPRGHKLTAMVDPYSYRDRFQKLPKLLINGTNDAYWPVDALNLYWDGIGENKSILYIPNNGHGLRDYGRILATAGAFCDRIGAKKPMPEMKWRFEANGEGTTALKIDADEEPVEVNVWVARSKVQDFRGAKWEKNPMAASGRSYSADFATPEEGFLAVFAEATFKNGEGVGSKTFTISTQIRVLGPVTSRAPAAAGAGAERTIDTPRGKAKLY